MRRLLLVLAALCALPAFAGELSLEGQAVQGGLLIGRTAPGAVARLDGRALRVSADGEFLVGFDRDAKPHHLLEIDWSDGRRERRTLEVSPRSYAIQRIDGLPPKQVTPPPEVLARIRAEAALMRRARSRDDPRTDFRSGFIWPSRGRISGVFGSQRVLNGKPRRPHYGVDIAAPVGTPVVAPADGIVTLTHDGMYFSGGTLVLDHGHGLSSAFLHLSRILVAEGARVRRGEPIAEIGDTGRVTGPHLDWRINLFDQRLDPALLVPTAAPEGYTAARPDPDKEM